VFFCFFVFVFFVYSLKIVFGFESF